MSSLLALSAPSLAPLPALLPALLPAPLPTPLPSQGFVAFTEAFTEHRDLVLGSPGLNTESHMTTYQAKTIWIQEQLFTSYGDAWRWVYDIENIVTRGACAADLVAQKIRLLDASAKSVEEISNMLKKNVVHLGLNKKSAKELRATLDGYVKAVSFTIHFRRSFYYKLLNLVNRIKRTKLDEQVIRNG